jgi:tRNA 2-selenouridine synthase
LAGHRGSVFGNIGLTNQASQEQFENEIAWMLQRFDLAKPIWIEDESRVIGQCHLPQPLYELMRQAPLFLIESNEENRLDNLLNLYGSASDEKLSEATNRICKRLGGQRTKEILDFIKNGNKREAFRLLLGYYDKAYEHQLVNRTIIQSLNRNELSDAKCAQHLKQILMT